MSNISLLGALNLLGLKNNCTLEDIKQSYRKMAMKYHPDRNLTLSKYEQEKNLEKFKEIKASYEFLLQNFENLNNPNKRNRNYSNFDEDFSDFMSDFDNNETTYNDFYQSYKNSFNKKRTFEPIKKQYIDKNKVVKISLADYFLGCEKALKFDVSFEKCKSCNYSFSTKSCEINCQQTRKEQKSIFIKIKVDKNIILPNHQTKKGELSNFIDIQFNLDFEISPNKKFRIENNNVYMDVKVPYHIALLGGEVSFKYFDKKTYLLKIPPLSQNNSLMRINNKGLTYKNYRGIFVGDLILKINIVIPKKLSKTTAEKLKEVYKNDEFVSLDNSAFE